MGTIWVLHPLHLGTGQEIQDFSQILLLRLLQLFPLLLVLPFSGRFDATGDRRSLESGTFAWKGLQTVSLEQVWGLDERRVLTAPLDFRPRY